MTQKFLLPILAVASLFLFQGTSAIIATGQKPSFKATVSDLRMNNVEIKAGSAQVPATPTYNPEAINFRQGVLDDEVSSSPVFHFIVFATNTSIFFYDPLVDTPVVRTLAVGFRNI
jgi:hypothetical protein